MRIAFLSMVWRDYWLLEKWISHNEKVVARRDLFVLNHGGDPEIDRIAAGCNVIHVPRDEVSMDLTKRRWRLIAGVSSGLLAFYDRVICTDVDEIIEALEAAYSNRDDAQKRAKAGVQFMQGLSWENQTRALIEELTAFL